MNSMEFPYGYTWTMSEWAERQRQQSREFLVNLSLALLLVFAVMAGLFESVRQAIGLMTSRKLHNCCKQRTYRMGGKGKRR